MSSIDTAKPDAGTDPQALSLEAEAGRRRSTDTTVCRLSSINPRRSPPHRQRKPGDTTTMIDVDAELQKMDDLFVRRADGYINATVLCKAFGKRWRDFVTFDHMGYTFHDYLGSLQAQLWIADAEDLVQAVGEELWVHTNIAVSLAEWLSMPFRYALDAKFAEAMWGGPPSQAQLMELVKPVVKH